MQKSLDLITTTSQSPSIPDPQSLSNFTLPLTLYLARLAPSGRRSMKSRLGKLFATYKMELERVQWHTMRYEHLEAISAKLQSQIPSLAPASINTTLSAIKSIAREAWHLGQMGAEDYHRLTAVKRVKGSRLPAGRDIKEAEVDRLFDVCYEDETPAGARDAALLSLIIGCGLRRSEVAALKLEHYEDSDARLRVAGKGNKERLVYLPTDATETLEFWLTLLKQAGKVGLVSFPSNCPLLCPVLKNGRLVLTHLSDQAIYLALHKRAIQAGVHKISPHDGRRTYIGNLLDAGADISAVQQLVGHANVTTTARYDRRGERVKQKAASLLTLPTRSRR